MEARVENKYVKLGMVVLKTKKIGYQSIKQHILSMKEIEANNGGQYQHQNQNQKEGMGKQNENELLTNIKAAYNKFYQIECESNEQITWKNTYYLILDKNNENLQSQQKRIQQKPTKQGWDWLFLQEKDINDKNRIEIQYSSSMINNLMNLIHRGQIKLCNPYLFEEPSRINMQNENDNENNNFYYISNLQNSFSYEIGFQVWVQQLILIKMNSNFQQFSIQSQQTQTKNKKQQQKQMNELFSQNKLEQQFINIVRQVFHEQTLKQNKNRAQNIIKSRTQRFFTNQSIGYSQYNSQQLKPYVSTHKQQGNLKNNVMSLNFADQKNQAGVFFDLIHKKTPQAKKPEEFSGDLKSYQARALTWMLIREGVLKDDIGIDMSHVPFWWDIGKDLCLGQKMMINTYLNFVTWKKAVDKSCQGGILADEMGLGKTIMIIALILANRPSKKEKTLIISPLSVVKQWKDQINKFAPTLRVHVINQSKISELKLESCDVVISTQGKIRSSMKKQQQDTNLLKRGWFRIVIDQAHNFKNSNTQMAKSIYQIQSKNRWCLTGTPTQNSLSDLFSLIKFLRFQPWCSIAWWNRLFPKNSKHTKPYHFTILKNLLKGILLRRKKESVDDEGKKLIELPKANVKVHFVQMNEEAKYLYQLVDYRAKISLKHLQKMEKKLKETKLSIKAKKNINEAKKLQYNYILSLMTKMRMICCHQFLSSYRTQFVTYENFNEEYLRFLSKNNVVRYPRYNFFQLYLASSEQKQKIRRPTKNLSKVYENWDEKIMEISRGKTYPCLICNCSFEEAVITPCVHTFCRRCIQSNVYSKWKVYEEQNAKQKRKKLADFQSVCPHCEDNLCLRQIYSYPRLNQFNRQLDEYKQNGKIRALLEYLKKMNPSDKALIFSSFIGMMTLIGYSLRQNGFTYLVIQGHDSYESRHEKIKQFNTNPNIKILILTLKIGSVGLNMEAANKVFFMDPWWNPAIQEQAVGRVHRIGQKKQVEAIKFITQQSIEARILKLSFIKKEVNDSVLDIDDIVNDKRYSKTRFEIKYLLSMQETLKQQSDDSSEQNEIKHMENNLSEDIYEKGLKMLIEKQKIKIQQDFSNLNGIDQVPESKNMQKQQKSSFSSIKQQSDDDR